MKFEAFEDIAPQMSNAEPLTPFPGFLLMGNMVGSMYQRIQVLEKRINELEDPEWNIRMQRVENTLGF